MANFNKVIIAGNLTRDPEVRYTPRGTAITRLSVALNRSYKTETGETREEVSYVDVDAFGRQAEVIAQYFRKGRPILIEGRLRQDRWEDKNTGQKQSKLMVVLESFSFIDSRGGGGETVPGAAPSARGSAPGKPAAVPAESPQEEPPIEDDDVPF